MRDKLITLETAKLTEEKGFNEITSHIYRPTKKLDMSWSNTSINSDLLKNSYSAPTQSLLRKWLRKVHKIHIDCNFDDNAWYISVGEFTIPDWCPDIHIQLEEKDSFKESLEAYEEALEVGLVEALKLIK
jgi:hypothetical protein